MEKILECFMQWNFKEHILSKKDSFDDYINHINLSCISGERHNPTTASICITENCNLHCAHCYQFNNGKTMECEEVYTLLDQLRKHHLLRLTITGGEPLLHPEILHILEYAKKLKFAITLQTNGILISEPFIITLKQIFTKKTDYVQVSLEGSTEAIHNLQRHSGYNEILENIKIMLNNGIRVVINITPTKYNQNDIYNTFLLANNLKVNGFHATPLAYLGRGEQTMEPDEEELLRQEYFILSHPSPYTQYYGGVSGELLHLVSIPIFKEALIEQFTESKKISNYTCTGGYFKLHVGADFEVYPCVFAQNPDLSMGNLLKQSFKQIWFEDYKNKMFFYTKRTLQSTKCKNCNLSAECRGGCPGIAFEKYRDINKPDPRCHIWE